MELEELKALMQLLKDTDISELLLEKDGLKIRLKREKVYGHFELQPAGVPEKTDDRREAIEAESSLFTVTSPIVGTFYRSPSPEAEPFVQVGTRAKKGQVLCIIEAMKLMNEIECEIDGVVTRVLVENGQPVEYGEPLFLIEPGT